MLEMARLVGTPPKEIILQTRAGNCVANNQACDPDARNLYIYNLLRGNHLAWVNRKLACGVYNCFGLVWASRRTAIYEERSVSQIIMEDGYRELRIEEQPQPGDVVVYLHLSGEIRNTLHAAVILKLEQRGPGKVPLLLSKWNDSCGEDIHEIRDVPQSFGNYVIEFWTDRQ
jgi:hypothetical protein